MKRRQFIVRLSLTLLAAGCTSKEAAEVSQSLSQSDKGPLPAGWSNKQKRQQNKGKGARHIIVGPYTHKNLSVFLVHGEDRLKGQQFLTLGEALEQKKILVHETGNVNELSIENISQEPVYVQSGDIVKGGKQDRVFAYDVVIQAQSGHVPVASFCVEQGRWSGRGAESAMYFSASQNQLATRELKLAAKYAGDQNRVWQEVAGVQSKLAKAVDAGVASLQSASSLQLTLENRNVQEIAAPYLKALSGIVEGKGAVIGYAFAINGTDH